ncbi:IS1634 family transposase [Streptosporangium sp. NBC_01810]|uniref:IS1634 family transposase n=1 Tax=Streptosporangium sp. NBC_01810 TaxID=2975951 RepID=UPI002DD90580|nr:IS1634 family transposase [Streptosporangium sp. NBC_01810]WSA22892.1 IS1634 family transposase [Streptosporangium sp. NBC_01810]WSA23214.1 IS1634 family transposase [Streptosporangium sp. NBC_01810]WSA25086.1 IS1634 family transposase [Streptosporangium sp. NBC_01810]WSA25089.1 IS1634 family transposase [Streptosporangium sp. NBC_01810]
MYVKTTSRKTKNGTAVRYLHLAHNEWDPVAGRSVPKILHSFGREDRLDRAAITRLVASLSNLLNPAEALTTTTPSDLAFLESRPYGGTYALDRIWHRLGIDQILIRLLQGRRGRPRDISAERVLFALVANRALAPSSKLAAADWISNDVHIDGLAATSDDACYRAMDWLHDVRERMEAEVYNQVANLLNLEVDLLFFDTTSTYFELDEADEPIARDERGLPLPGAESESEFNDEQDRTGFRTYGKSKDSRDDLPQIVIGMAVTRSGIPVRVWSWPGNTSDSALIRQVKDDMRDWTLSKIVWVADRGFASAANRRYLRQGDHHYIIGEKLRSDSPEITTALSRQGRYADIAANMRIKEVKVSEHERFVICHNPEAAARDAHVREQLITQLHELIDGSDTLSAIKRAELRGKISTRPALNRYLRTTPGGRLRINARAINAEANLDGKYLLRCSDPHLPAEDIAVGYKQLLEVERGWRDMKSIIDLRPVYHRREERIRAHVILCWLALLLVRIIENTVGETWMGIRRHLNRLQIGTFHGPAGRFRQRTEPTKVQRDLLAKLGITPPQQIIELATPF